MNLSLDKIHSYFNRRVEHFGQKQRTWKHWLKWLAVVDVERQIILAQWARQAPWNDCATLPVLVGQAHQHTPIDCVLADAEFDSERDHTFYREQPQAQSIIPTKRSSSCRASGVRLQMREHFPTEQYGKRSLIESVFSAVKRKLSCRAPGRPSTRSPAKPFCSDWPSTCTASGCLSFDCTQTGCQQRQTTSRAWPKLAADSAELVWASPRLRRG